MNDRAIFIGGHSRTGTTLIQGLVCNHPETGPVTREASYFRALVEAFELGQRWFDLHTCDYFADREGLTEFHRGVTESYFRHLRSRFGVPPDSVIVQKEPRMTEFFPEVAILVTQARFLVMLRDLRDIVASQHLRAAKSGGGYSPDEDVNRYLRTLRRLIMHRELLEQRLMFVWYEGLVTRPSEVMSQVWRFLGLSDLPVDGNTPWVTKRPRRDDSASELDGKPPTPDQIGRNRHVLNGDAMTALENARRLVRTRVDLDPFGGDGVRQGGKATFFLEDILRPG